MSGPHSVDDPKPQVNKFDGLWWAAIRWACGCANLQAFPTWADAMAYANQLAKERQ